MILIGSSSKLILMNLYEENPVRTRRGTQGLKMVSLMKYRSLHCEKIKTWAKNQREAGQPSEGVFIVWDQGGFIC